MTELKYDPEFPYVVLIREDYGPDVILGKFPERAYANQLKNAGISQFREIVDTTPKPKIPEDANYVFVEDGDQSVFAYRIVFPDGSPGWMTVGGGPMNDEELLEYIGDELVTVMVEKEDA